MSHNTSQSLVITVTESTTGSVLFQRQKTGPPSLAVIEAASEIIDTDPTQLEPPLNDVVDPDALDRLFERTHQQTSKHGIEISFSYADHRVTITGNSRGHASSTSPEFSSAHQ